MLSFALSLRQRECGRDCSVRDGRKSLLSKLLNDKNPERCFSLQKSSYGYTRLPLFLTREYTESRREVRDPPFLWTADFNGIRCPFLQMVPCDTQQFIHPWKAGTRRTWGGLGRPSFFVRCRYCSNSHDMKSFHSSRLVVC